MVQEGRHQQAQHHDARGHLEQPAAAAQLVSPHAAQRREDAKHHRAHQQQAGEGIGRNAQAHRMACGRQRRRALGINLHKSRHQVEQHVGGGHAEDAAHQGACMVLEHRAHRGLQLAAFALYLLEGSAFVQIQSHVQAHGYQHEGHQEGDAPGPGDHGFRAQVVGHQEEHAVGHKQANRCAQLGKAAKQAALALRRVFSGDQCRATPFTTQANTLADAADAQQNRRQNADAFVIGQQADGYRRQAHGQQRSHQRGLAADAVAKVAKQGRANRAGQEGQRQGRQRQQGGGRRVALGEELAVEHQHRSSGVDVVIVKLDRGAHQGRDGYFAGRVALHSSRCRHGKPFRTCF